MALKEGGKKQTGEKLFNVLENEATLQLLNRRKKWT